MKENDFQEIRYLLEAGHAVNLEHVREELRTLWGAYLTLTERNLELETALVKSKRKRRKGNA